MDDEHKRIINEWQNRHINKVIEYFVVGSVISPAAAKFGPVYDKLAQGLVDSGYLREDSLVRITTQIPEDEWQQFLFWIARDCLPRSKRPPHYTEDLRP